MKKIRETKKPEFIREKHFVEQKNEGRKPDKNLSLRRLEFMPGNSTKKPFKNSLSGLVLYYLCTH